MHKLKDFEGQTIILVIPNPNRSGGLQRESVKLLNVDDAGIWIENQALTNATLAALNLPATQQVLTAFYPYAAIHAILVETPGLSLSEKAFGV
jgi:hypothetical protein